METLDAMTRLFPGVPAGIRFITINRTDTEGFLYRFGSRVIVAFAGTESLRDLWTDIWFLPGAYYLENEQMCVHTGFARVINEIRLTLAVLFRSLFLEDPENLGRITEVIGVGHSLGAAVALGALDILWYAFPEIRGRTRAVTFGCPNGWSRSAIEAWNDRHPAVNQINPWDYVTWLLGITTGRPGRDVRLRGRAGHFMDKYIDNLEGSHHG
jgi:hypothetical protein